MTGNQSRSNPTSDTQTVSSIDRRELLVAGGGLSAFVLAGCTSEQPVDDESTDDSPEEQSDGEASDGDTDDAGESSTAPDANFRLLISDMPADIGDFNSLAVSFENARIFDGGNGSTDEDSSSDDGEDGASGNGGNGPPDHAGNDDDEATNENESDGDSEAEADSTEDNGDESTDENNGVDRRQGFYILDLDGATVDLTEVIGEKAMSVFEGQLSEGTYNKIELNVASIEGIVDGEKADVKVPSEKLQITHSFEISAGSTTDFVFDINVVQRGQRLSYNLTPVISDSGVAGEDVDVEEIPAEEDSGSSEEHSEEDEEFEEGEEGEGEEDGGEEDEDDEEGDDESDSEESDDGGDDETGDNGTEDNSESEEEGEQSEQTDDGEPGNEDADA